MSNHPNEMSIDSKKIFSIFRRKLIFAGEDIDFLPLIFKKKPLTILEHKKEEYYSLTFIDAILEKKISNYIENSYDAFPGLIKPKDIDTTTAYRLSNSKNMHFQNVKIRDMYSFHLGPNSSLILENYTQIIDSEKLGEINYTIDLSYIISFGDEINLNNLYDYLEQLISYSLNIWRSQPAKK